MEKTRVNYGEKFWFFRADGKVSWAYEYGEILNKDRFDCGNYFHTKEEAEVVARKIRAVLNGAYVVDKDSSYTQTDDEAKAKAKQIEMILSHRQTIVIAENYGVLNWYWNTKSITSRNDILERVIVEQKLK